MRLGKGIFCAFSLGFVLSSCGSSQDDFLSQRKLAYAATESRVEEVSLTQDRGITVQALNTDFQTVRRMERLLRADSPLAVSPTEDLVDSAQKAAHDLNPETQLQLLHLRRGDRFIYATFQQILDGRPVVGARFILRMNASGDWVSANSRLVHPRLLQTVDKASTQAINISHIYGRSLRVLSEQSVVLPHLEGDSLSLHAAREFLVFDDALQSPLSLWVDESNQEMLTVLSHRRNLKSVVIEGSISPNSPSDELSLLPLGFASLYSGITFLGFTDAAGKISVPETLSAPLSISLENKAFKVIRQGLVFQPTEMPTELISDDHINLSQKISSEETNTFYWLNQIGEFHKNKLGFSLPYQLKAFTHYNGVRPSCLGEIPSTDVRCIPNAEDADNAFFMGGMNILALGSGGSFLKNTALSRDIVVHEFGHAITDEIYGPLNNYEFAAMNEAFSDYLAATFSGDPLIAEGAMQSETNMDYLRRVDNTLTFTADFDGQAYHGDGQIFSGALWDIRQAMGAELADKTFHEARLAQAATVREFFLELLTLDEDRDDKNPFTPSKYRSAIMKAFYHRGLTGGTVFSK